ERIERKDKVRQLIFEAEQHRKFQRWEQAIERYEAAHGLDRDNKLVRVHMARAYAGWARDLLAVDRKAAEKLIQTGLGPYADNPEVRELQLMMLQEVTNDLVDRALTKARELRARGEMAETEPELRSALKHAPADPALQMDLTELSKLNEAEKVIAQTQPPTTT